MAIPVYLALAVANFPVIISGLFARYFMFLDCPGCSVEVGLRAQSGIHTPVWLGGALRATDAQRWPFNR